MAVGGERFPPGNRRRGELGLRFNSAVLVDREGGTALRYDKAHIVPLGEFFPARPLLQGAYCFGGKERSLNSGSKVS
jgi:apolipoprotein N-acyltransferase